MPYALPCHVVGMLAMITPPSTPHLAPSIQDIHAVRISFAQSSQHKHSADADQSLTSPGMLHRIGGKVWYRGPDMPTRASNNAELVERQKRLKAVQQQVLNRRPRPRDLKAYQVQHDMTPARFDAVRRRENPLFKE